jgi:hypothetical protein
MGPGIIFQMASNTALIVILHLVRPEVAGRPLRRYYLSGFANVDILSDAPFSEAALVLFLPGRL